MASARLFIFWLAMLLAAVQSEIQWGPCPAGEFVAPPVLIECGTLAVPLDYTSPNSSTLELGLVRILAPIQPAHGSVLLNFGGPGAEARQAAVSTSPILQQLSGNAFNLLAFDPRGTGTTIPFNCTDDPFDKARILDAAIQDGEAYDEVLAAQWARGKVDSNICVGNNPELSGLVGTAFVARDLISVVDALEEDGMLRFWGFSYGTTLGATVAAMFPDRIDKMVLDGVQNVHEYYNAHADFEEWIDSDKALVDFFETCIAAGFPTCPIARKGETAASLEETFWATVTDLQRAPRAAGSRVVTASLARILVVYYIKLPLYWEQLAGLLSILFWGTDEELTAIINAFYTVGFPDAAALDSFQGLWAIHCSDRVPRAETMEELEPTFTRLLQTSRLTGPTATQITAHCARWGAHAREIYSGPFEGIRTAGPLLIVGSTLDAHTPMQSARNTSAIFEGSVVLEVAGTGHCATLNVPSACAAKAMVEYWTQGLLPALDTVCAGSAPPFSGLKWADVFEMMAFKPSP